MYCTTTSLHYYTFPFKLHVHPTATYIPPHLPLYSIYCTTTCMYCISPLTFLLYTFPFKLPYSYIYFPTTSLIPLYTTSLSISTTLCIVLLSLHYIRTFPFKLPYSYSRSPLISLFTTLNIHYSMYCMYVQVLMTEAKGLPVAVYRPSIIGASLNEPVEVRFFICLLNACLICCVLNNLSNEDTSLFRVQISHLCT